jgi:hypothetical protein
MTKLFAPPQGIGLRRSSDNTVVLILLLLLLCEYRIYPEL